MKTKNLKIWAGVMATLIAMMNLVPVVSAADVTVTVTVQYLSVTISPSGWSLGTIVAGTIKNMTASENITINNSGNWPVNYTLKLTDPAGWTAASTVSANQYVMSGLIVGINETNVNPSNFAAEDVLTTSLQLASSTVFGMGGTSISNNTGVPANGLRSLWLQFKAPTSTNVGTQQSITITLGVVAG